MPIELIINKLYDLIHGNSYISKCEKGNEFFDEIHSWHNLAWNKIICWIYWENNGNNFKQGPVNMMRDSTTQHQLIQQLLV